MITFKIIIKGHKLIVKSESFDVGLNHILMNYGHDLMPSTEVHWTYPCGKERSAALCNLIGCSFNLLTNRTERTNFSEQSTARRAKRIMDRIRGNRPIHQVTFDPHCWGVRRTCHAQGRCNRPVYRYQSSPYQLEEASGFYPNYIIAYI
jgi:hypothetical protein